MVLVRAHVPCARMMAATRVAMRLRVAHNTLRANDSCSIPYLHDQAVPVSDDVECDSVVAPVPAFGHRAFTAWADSRGKPTLERRGVLRAAVYNNNEFAQSSASRARASPSIRRKATFALHCQVRGSIEVFNRRHNVWIHMDGSQSANRAS